MICWLYWISQQSKILGAGPQESKQTALLFFTSSSSDTFQDKRHRPRRSLPVGLLCVIPAKPQTAYFYKPMCAQLLQLCLPLCKPTDCWPTRLFCPWDSPGKNTGVGCQALLQGFLSTRDLARISFVSCIGRWVLYHQGHPRTPSKAE